jgi:hypothetical protein
MDTSNKNRLRLVRIAGDSVLKEKILPKERLNRESVAMMVAQMKSIIEAMQAEWELDPLSRELEDAFLLLRGYLHYIKTHPLGIP